MVILLFIRGDFTKMLRSALLKKIRSATTLIQPRFNRFVQLLGIVESSYCRQKTMKLFATFGPPPYNPKNSPER